MMVSIMAHQQGDLHGSEASFPNTQNFLLVSTHSLSFLIYRAGHTERICLAIQSLFPSILSKKNHTSPNKVYSPAMAYFVLRVHD